jgi:hypothetical protein
MEKALLVNDIGDIETSAPFTRVYFGTEVCQKRIPGLNVLRAALAAVRKKKKDFTFVTPYVTDGGMDKLEKDFRFLAASGEKCEVVFSDWGVFKLLRDDFPGLAPVLGRLLSKQRTDPMAYPVLHNAQMPRRVMNRVTKTDVIILPKAAPPSVLRQFCASPVNVPLFQKFLISNGVRRIEIDNLLWGMDIRPRRGLGISLHLPYGIISTTRLCGLVNLTYRRCRGECARRYLDIKGEAFPVHHLVSGNTVWYRSKTPDGECLRKNHVDRIVFDPRKMAGEQARIPGGQLTGG